MALIAWYPLNGDTKDYSGNNLDAINSGAKETSEGKIGKAYSFENDSSGINIPNQNFDHLKEYTMSAWVKPKGNHRNYNGAIISSGNWNSQAWSFGLSQNNTSIDVASNRYNVYVSYTVPLNEWTHIASTMKNGIAKVYVNGKYITQRSATAQLQSNATNTFIGRETYAGGHFSFNGDLNDIRVYDHALSDKEISEIAKAKILHYKFDDPYEEPTENLINPKLNTWAGDGKTEVKSDYRAKFTNYGRGTSTDWGRVYSEKIDVKQGEKITFSFNYHGHVGRCGIHLREHNTGGRATAGLISFNENKEYPHKRYESTITVPSGVEFYTVWIHFYNQSYNFIYEQGIEISNFQVERKDSSTPFTSDTRDGLFYDSSGFENHGTTNLTKTPGWTISGKVGAGGLEFDNSDFYHPNPFMGQAVKEQEWTVAAWVKPEGTGRPQINNFNTYNGMGVGGTTSLLYLSGGVNDYYTYGGTYPSGEWSLLTFVFRNSDGLRKIYRNGVDISTSGPNKTSTPTGIPNNVRVGANYKGLMSEYSIYATALSQEDILELYQSRANVDNKGALSSNVFKENPINICPPFEYWSLSGGAYLDENELVLPTRGARATSPIIYIGENNRSRLSLDYYSKDNRPQDEKLGGYLRGSSYYDLELKPRVNTSGHSGNGNAGTYPLGEWSRNSWYPAQGNGIAYVSYNLSNNSTYTGESYKVANPTIVINSNSTDYYPYSKKIHLGSKLSLINSKGVISINGLNEIGLPIRYIRESMNGSNKNTSSHWVEIEAYNQNDVNVALGKSANHTYLTDGNTNSSPYYGVGGKGIVEVDLGDIYHVSYLRMYHYYADARIYNDIKTEVSANGTDWTTVFDSNVDGEYVETAAGNTIILRPDKMIQDDKGNLYVSEIKEV